MLIAHNDLELAIAITAVSVKDWQKQPLAWVKIEGGYLCHRRFEWFVPNH
jgi:hypothetical protein